MAAARRATGLAALEAGEYDKALIHFTEAKSLAGDKANVIELLRITEDLRTRARSGAVSSPRPPALVPGSSPPPASRATRGSTRAPTASSPAPREAVNPPEPKGESASGILLVTSNPRGLLVHLDGAAADLTPMRTSVKSGRHRVSLYDADRKLYETSVDVGEGAAATVFKDLSSELSEASRPAPPANPPPAAEESRLAAAIAPVAEPPAALAPKAPPGNTGSLDISSPGVYGVIWVNGRSLGFPPVQVSDFPAGPVKIDVRVNGVEKRSTTAVVQPGLTTFVKVR